MALQSSGPISLLDIQNEFGGTNPIGINEYYGAAAGVPASGTISFDDFYGTSSGPSTNGLQLYFDIGNSSSYSGSGSTLNDLSSNGNNSTLVNSPTYVSSNGGYLSFNGTSQYFDFFAANLGSVATIDMWVQIRGINNEMPFGWNQYDVYATGGAMGYNTFGNDVHGLTSTQVTNLGIVNNWKHLVFVMRTDVSYTNNKIYVNKVQQTLSQVQGSETSSRRNFNSGNGRSPGSRQGTSYLMPLYLSSFKVYNRELTQTEINQNYDADVGRF